MVSILRLLLEFCLLFFESLFPVLLICLSKFVEIVLLFHGLTFTSLICRMDLLLIVLIGLHNIIL